MPQRPQTFGAVTGGELGTTRKSRPTHPPLSRRRYFDQAPSTLHPRIPFAAPAEKRIHNGVGTLPQRQGVITTARVRGGR